MLIDKVIGAFLVFILLVVFALFILILALMWASHDSDTMKDEDQMLFLKEYAEKKGRKKKNDRSD